MSTYEAAAQLDFFNQCLDELVVELVRDDLDVRSHGFGLDEFAETPVRSVDEEEVNKCAWIASVLASSGNEDHRRKALAFGVLSYIRSTKNDVNEAQEEAYRRYLYIILARLGNLPAFNNIDATETELTFEQQLVRSVDSVLGAELVSTRDEYELESGPILSKFQNDIYKHLIAGRNVAISGPTSSGKSFILQQYIEKKVSEEEQFQAIYVVPTRALISEVSRDLSQLEGVTVRPGMYFDQTDENATEDIEKDLFLVVTPERCRRIVDPDIRTEIEPDLVFFDEVQNIEDDERGVLFEGVVELLNQYYPDSQIVAAGPYLDNPGETLEALTNNEVAEVQSAFTPVLQLKVSLQFRPGRNTDISAKVHSPSGEIRRIDIPEPEDLSYTQVDTNKTESLPTILEEFAKNSKTLVYSGKKNYAEKRAKRIANSKEKQPLSPDLEELKSFLTKAIHKDYSLIECLERGVAFHHGNVPKFAREEIEEIYSETGDLHTIVTTPTLMQGVNLPAEKIFLVGAKKGSEDLSDFEFNNLIGRVGRVDTKLYGAIYCIETQNDEWADEKLSGAGEKEVEPATNQAVSKVEELISAIESKDLTSVEDIGVKYTAILLRGRYLKEDKSVRSFLENKGMQDENIKKIQSSLEEVLEEVNLPNKYLRKNPTVDPVKLDQLYHLVDNNVGDWIIENRYQNLYSNLLSVTRNLNRVFKFSRDKEYDITPENIETECPVLEPIVVNATQWLEGSSYGDLIESRRNHKSTPDDESIDRSIRETMSIVDQDICFRLVKYFGILITILEDIKEDETPSWMLQLDSMLEMGSMNIAELKLMSAGVDRSVAVDLQIPLDVEEPQDFLRSNPNFVPSFHKKHLEKQDIL
ncbi:DEAD/DEAH box helicase [Halobellus salinisoli]|uniref:DEAD/DEAH box helicase n=1 Tax=Halobellus salinisoli TaxID=3108500 RepID=UPI00300B8A69